jgi:hypothetical protein
MGMRGVILTYALAKEWGWELDSRVLEEGEGLGLISWAFKRRGLEAWFSKVDRGGALIL